MCVRFGQVWFDREQEGQVQPVHSQHPCQAIQQHPLPMLHHALGQGQLQSQEEGQCRH